ncbi:unnamed protein product [Arabidopsis arenosa]|uniref:DUF1985 domain-containing protein n=1 Tax=Arabidopsis arenosa TaxID=38785 RepID=A0A8S2ACS2_ARAAE|nr:unnamed protein product [Arabidopsis arenosa]
MPYNPFFFMKQRVDLNPSIRETNTDSGSKTTDPEKAPGLISSEAANNPSEEINNLPPEISSPSKSDPSNSETIGDTSKLPPTNASDAQNELLPVMSSPSRSNTSNPGEDASSNPDESAPDLLVNFSPSRSKTTDPELCAGSASPILDPSSTEVDNHLPSESTIPASDVPSTSRIPSESSPDLLPPRLFATDRYPVRGRINSYSRPEYLLDLVEVLDEKKKMQTAKPGEAAYFNTLIGPNKTYSIREIVSMLQRDKRLPSSKRMSGERRLRLALIVIVEGILVCNSSAVKASKKVAEMLKDVDSFVKYPWGRKSFKRSLEMVKLGPYNQSVSFLVDKLCQSHTATHGFTLSFQLLALHAIPLLQRYLPDLNDEQTFTDRSVLQLTQLKTFHNSNILQTENDPNVDIECILHTQDEDDLQDFSWTDEVEDLAVDNIFNKLKDGHVFNKSDWHGGVSHLPLLSDAMLAAAAKTKNVSKPIQKKQGTKKASKPKPDKEIPEASNSPKVPDDVDVSTREQILREVERRNNEHTSQIKEMLRIEMALYKDEIVDQVIRNLKENGVNNSSVKLSTNDTMPRNNKWDCSDHGTTFTDILNKVSIACKDPIWLIRFVYLFFVENSLFL